MSNIFYDELGPRARRRAAVSGVVLVVLFLALILCGFLRLESKGQLESRLWRVLLDPELIQLLLQGLISTAQAASTALVLSLVGGALLAFGLLAEQRATQFVLRIWVELFRGLPVLLLIFCVYLGAPAVGVSISTFWALVTGLTLFNSAVFAEIFRAGVTSLPRGQREAGYTIGLDASETLRLILIPQAVRRMLPVLVSQSVVLLKETSFGFIIGYSELLREGRSAVEFLGGQYSLPIYTLLAVIYIAVNLALSSLARWLHSRTYA
ncbi:amino acid ABC transporter permease [Caballeronia sp. DA-9]|uniref:amino acid ABC transporter permease n=1 Tax=Caballeronia sp. DA-9 TaxID=3436237 RepID=UPI003F671333